MHLSENTKSNRLLWRNKEKVLLANPATFPRTTQLNAKANTCNCPTDIKLEYMAITGWNTSLRSRYTDLQKVNIISKSSKATVFYQNVPKYENGYWIVHVRTQVTFIVFFLNVQFMIWKWTHNTLNLNWMFLMWKWNQSRSWGLIAAKRF